MNDIDDIFRNELRNHGLEYKETYWNDMEQMLNKKKKRRGILIFGALGMLLLGVMIGYGLFHTEKTKSESMYVNTKKEVKNAPEIIENTFSDNPIENEPTDEDVYTTNSTNKLQESKQIADNSNTNQLDSKTASNQQRNEVVTDTKVDAKVSTEPSGKLLKTNVTTNETVIVEGLTINTLIKLPVIIPDYDISAIVQIPFTIATVKKDSIQTVKPWQYVLIAGYEYDKYSRDVNSNLLKVDEITQNSSGFNLGFGMGKNNWKIKSGLGYMQLKEYTNYTSFNTNYTYDTSYQMVDPNFGQTPSGRSIALIKQKIDSVGSVTSVVNNPNSKVQFTYIKIPLIGSYEFQLKRLGLVLDAGFNASVLVQKSGNYTTFNGSNYEVKDIKNSNDISKLLMQTYAAVGIRYHIDKSVSIYGGYGRMRSINSMIKSYSQKPKVDLFTFGLEFNFH